MKNIFKFKSLIIFFLQNNTYLNKYIKIKIKLFIFTNFSIIFIELNRSTYKINQFINQINPLISTSTFLVRLARNSMSHGSHTYAVGETKGK